MGRRWADFVVLDGDTPVHVIEVKKVIKEAQQGGWQESPDFAQLRWYTDELDTPGMLFDSHRILLVERDGTQPRREIVRRSSTGADVEAIRRHLLATQRAVGVSDYLDTFRRAVAERAVPEQRASCAAEDAVPSALSSSGSPQTGLTAGGGPA